MNKDLRQFLNLVREMGPDYYVEAQKPLSWKYEPCILQEKLAAQGRFPVIYCPQIEGSKIPLVTDLFGSYDMLGLALGVDARKAGKAAILQEYNRRENDRKPPKTVPKSAAPVKEIMLKGRDVDLGVLPIIHHQEGDSGRYISIGCMICKDPDTGMYNIGVYRHEVRGKDILGAMLVPTHHAAYIARRYAELKKPMEVVLFIGHHPSVVIGACCKGGMNEDELAWVGGVMGEPLEVTPGETVDIPVPAFAEIAIEGRIEPDESIMDGPFGEFTRYYGEPKASKVIKVTAITMRHDAIYHDLDNAHREHNYSVSLPNESCTYNAVRKSVPTVQAVYYPYSGICEFHVYVSIKKKVQGEGKFAGLAALASNSELKMAVVVDDDVDIYDDTDVLWAIATRVEADRSISYIPFTAGANLDPTAYGETRNERGAMVTKTIIDATKPVGIPFSTRIRPPEAEWAKFKLEDYLK